VLGLNRSKVCRDCKQKRGFIEKEKAKHERMAENHRAGLILVHSCISDPRNKSEYVCRCRRWVTREVAAKIVKAGECVDYETRNEFFFGKGRDVLTTRKKLRAPRTRTITRPEIENAIGDLQRRLAQVPQELREEVEEMLTAPRTISIHVPTINQIHIHSAWHSESGSEKAQEERERIEIYGQLTREMWQGLIREVPAEEYDRTEESHRGVPVIWSGIGEDDRTLGGVGRTVFSPHTQIAGFEEFEMVEEDENAEAIINDQESIENQEAESTEDDDNGEVIPIDRNEEVNQEEIEEDVEAA
jgi:hypothetical protein